MYFTLKDDRSRLRCVFFKGRSAGLRFQPQDGMSVVVGGSLGVYEVAGDYQIYVDELVPAGVGELHLAFEQLKERLTREGLTDPARKRPLPPLPQTVGIVTSPTGAALRDIVSVLKRRFPNINILLAPAVVQGESGPESVVRAIENMNRRDDVDVLIVGRGGGSIEELWTFNDERVARAIAASRIPVISAVGHETDVTIADFVADLRAPTPSAAAEIAVPERDALLRELAGRIERMRVAQSRRIARHRESLQLLASRGVLVRPTDRIGQLRQQIDDLLRRAESSVVYRAQLRRERLEVLVGKLESLSPLKTLARGYSICTLKASQTPLTDASAVEIHDSVRVRLSRGELICIVEGKEEVV